MGFDRREFLKWTGVAAVVAVAGCGGTEGGEMPSAIPDTGTELMKVGLYTWDEILFLPDQVDWLQLHYARAGVMNDELMKFCSEHGIDVLLNITPAAPRTAFATDQEFITAYHGQVDAALRRYGTGGDFWRENPTLPAAPITQIEVCNEPNFGYGFSGDIDSVAPLYAHLLIDSYRFIKATWPDVTVVGFAAGGASNAAPDFISAAFSALQAVGDVNCFDVVSIHPYSSNKPPEQTIVESWGTWSARESIDEIRQLMLKFGVTKPLWITEVGYQISHADGGKFEVTIDNQVVGGDTVTPRQQAAYSVRVNMAAARYDIPRVYHMFAVDTDNYNGGWFGPGPNHDPRPVAVAMRQVIELLSGATYLEVVLDGEPDKPESPFAYRFSTPRGTVLVAWCQVPSTFELQLPADTQTAVTDMLGNAIATTRDQKFQATLSEEPIFLHSTPV